MIDLCCADCIFTVLRAIRTGALIAVGHDSQTIKVSGINHAIGLSREGVVKLYANNVQIRMFPITMIKGTLVCTDHIQ